MIAATLAVVLIAVVAGAHVQVVRRELWRRRLLLALRTPVEDEETPNRAERRAQERDAKRVERAGRAPKWWLTHPPQRDTAQVAARTRLGKVFERGVAAVVAVALLVAFVGTSAGTAVARGVDAPQETVAGMPAGTVTYEVGSFQKIATATTQDITITTNCFSGSPIAGIMFWHSGVGAVSGTWSAGIAAGIGYASVNGATIVEHAVGVTSDDAAGTSNTARRMAAKCLTLPTTSGAGTQWEANVTFTSATNMRLNWTTNAGGTERVNYKIIGGLTGAKVVNWTAPAGTGSKTVTGADFTPDLVLHAAGPVATTIPSSATYAYLGFGIMNKSGQQGANHAASEDAVAGSSNTSRYQQTDACFVAADPSGNVMQQAHWEEMNSDGFKIYFSTNSIGAYAAFSLCLAGCSSKIGSFTKPTEAATATKTVDSRQGFTPKGLIFSNMGAAPTSGPAAVGAWSLGATDLTNERGVALFDNDAVSPTQADSVWYSGKSLVVPDGGGGPAVGVSRAVGSVSAVTTSSFTTSWTTNDSQQTEILYCLLGDAGTNTYPTGALDTATTNSAATSYSNQKKMAVLSTGRRVRVIGETTTNARFEWSDTGLAGSWTDYAADVAGWDNGSIFRYVDSGGVEYVIAGWQQNGAGGGRTNNYSYVMVGTLNAGRTTLTWGTALAVNGGVSGRHFPDLVSHAEGTGGVAHIVMSEAQGAATDQVTYTQVAITSGGVPSVTSGPTAISANYLFDNYHYPSIDINLTDKRLHVAWSAGTTGSGKGIRYRTASYSAGVWTWATEVEVSTLYYAVDSKYGVNCRWDGTAVIIAGNLVNAGITEYRTLVWESTNFTSFGTPIVNDNMTGITSAYLYATTLAIDPATRNIYLLGMAYVSSYSVVGYRRYNRATSTFELTVATDPAFFSTSSPTYVNASYNSSASAIEWVYPRGNNSPYAIDFDQIVLNVAPTAATWVTTSAAYDVAASLPLQWTFVDPNSGDTQSAYALRRDIGGVVTYYRASDATWQVAEVKNISTSTTVTLVAGWGLDADANHLFTVKTWDSRDTVGVYNSSLVITPTAKVNPTLDTPAPAAVVGTSSLTAAWTVAQQSEYLAELLDNAGTTVLATSLWTANAATRTWVIPYTLANGTSYKARLTTKNTEGLTSNSVTNSFSVSYTAPATATVAVVSSSNYKIVLTVTNPAPTGSQPAVTENRVWRRRVGDTTTGTRVAIGVANNGTWTDIKVGHLEAWEYRIEVIGANGTTSFSAWTA